MRSCNINRGNRKTTTKKEIKFGPDGDMFIAQSTFEQDFKYLNEYVVRGVYHWDTERSVVYLQGHEVIEDIISTCEHETIHHCLKDIQLDAENFVSMDDEQEHRMIRNMAWAEETITKEYSSHYNEALREFIEEE